LKSNLFGAAALGLFALLTPATLSAQALSELEFKIPEWKSADGTNSVRMRGRWQHDWYSVNTDFDGISRDLDISKDDTRNIRVGMEGVIAAKFGFRAEVTLLNSQTNWLDLYATYRGKNWDVFVGQQYQASSLEGSLPDAFFLLPEATMMTNAFALRARNLGGFVRYKGSNWEALLGATGGNVNAGDVFGDDVLRTVQGRASFAPRNKPGDYMHFGINFRTRDAQEGPLFRYRARPVGINYGVRPIDTGEIANSDRNLGLEFVRVRGPFTSYLEASYWLTGETRPYRYTSGNFQVQKPKKSILKGGPGAWGLAARLERLDMSSPGGLAPRANPAGISQGKSSAIVAGIVWMPVEYVTFRLSGSRTQFDGVAAGFTGKGSTDSLTAKAQFSF
jgi:phosphate-selective porin OprO and OprP